MPALRLHCEHARDPPSGFPAPGSGPRGSCTWASSQCRPHYCTLLRHCDDGADARLPRPEMRMMSWLIMLRALPSLGPLKGGREDFSIE
eukprot:363065-Chlamydomonas_euryale.AAC.5